MRLAFSSGWSRKRVANSLCAVLCPIALLPTICRLHSKTLQQLAGQALRSRRGPQYGHAHEVVWMFRWATVWQVLVFVMDCDAAAAFDHISHHEIIKATLAMGVLPVLMAACVREYRNSETVVKLGDIVTLGCVAQDQCHKVIHVRLVCLEQHWMWETGILVFCCSQTIAGSSRCHQESFKR